MTKSKSAVYIVCQIVPGQKQEQYEVLEICGTRKKAEKYVEENWFERRHYASTCAEDTLGIVKRRVR